MSPLIPLLVLILSPLAAFWLGWNMGARGQAEGRPVKLFKDLLYGGRNEYLDVVRLLGLLGGLTFLGLTIAHYVQTRAFDGVTFGVGWASVLTATVGAIYARNHSDRVQLETNAGGGQ